MDRKLAFIALLVIAVGVPCAAQRGEQAILTQAPSGSTNASFINANQCATPSTANCTISSLSIPSGSIIMVLTVDMISANAVLPTDSNSDTAVCDAQINDGNGVQTRFCIIKAGAIVTAVTCNQTVGTPAMDCVASWYSPGSLTAAQDQSALQAQGTVTAWSSTTTAGLSGSNDLVAGAEANGNVSLTTTLADGGTSRITCATQYSCVLEDRNVSGTTGVAASGTLSSGSPVSSHVMAVK